MKKFLKERTWAQVPFWIARRDDRLQPEKATGPSRYVRNLALVTFASLPFLSYALLPDKQARTPVRDSVVDVEASPSPSTGFPVFPGPPAIEAPLPPQTQPIQPAPTVAPAPTVPPAPAATTVPAPPAATASPGASSPAPAPKQPAPVSPPSAPSPPPVSQPGPAQCDAVADPANFDDCIKR